MTPTVTSGVAWITINKDNANPVSDLVTTLRLLNQMGLWADKVWICPTQLEFVLNSRELTSFLNSMDTPYKRTPTHQLSLILNVQVQTLPWDSWNDVLFMRDGIPIGKLNVK